MPLPSLRTSAVLLVLALFPFPALAQSGTETAIYSFCSVSGASSCTDGAYPVSGLMQAADGNYYGTTTNGGTYQSGTIYRITPGGAYSVLYSFTGNDDGSYPIGGLVQGGDGYLYGTTTGEGQYYSGTIFKISLGGEFSLVYTFTGGADGSQPKGPLVLASDGNFYGTTAEGGSHSYYGGFFQMSPGGTVTPLYGFTGGNDGGQPQSGLVQGVDGNLYGTTGSGTYEGTLFQFVPGTLDTINTLYSFTGADTGANPFGGLVQGPDGTFYGTTDDGASTYCEAEVVHGPRFDGGGCGTIYSFALTGANTGTVTPLYEFTGSSDGFNPMDTLIFGSDGNLYGTANAGGADANGSIFQVTTSGTLTPLFGFCAPNDCSDGQSPYQGLVQGSDGNFYGTTRSGGSYSEGVVFRYAPATQLNAPIQLSAPAAAASQVPVTVGFQSSNSFSLSMQQCFAFATNQSLGGFYPLGAVSGTVSNGIYSGSVTGTPEQYGSYLVAVTCGGVESGLATIEVGKTSLNLSAGSSSLISGQTGTLIATVSEANVAGVGEGNIAVTCGNESLGTQAVNASGVADFSINTAGLPGGSYSCSARYSDPLERFSPSSATQSFGVQNQTTTVTLSPASANYYEGVSSQLTATVTGQISTPTSGYVHFVAADEDFGYVALDSSGQAVLTASPVGPLGVYTVTATYSGTVGTSGSSTTGTYTLEANPCNKNGTRGKAHPEC